MDLDFSLLTFSPSQRNLKSSGAGKTSSKRTLLQRRLYSVVRRRGSVVYQATCASTTDLLSEQENLTTTNVAVCDSGLQSCGTQNHKPTFKSRVGKGKENRGTDLCAVDLSSDSGRLGVTNATNCKNCRHSCDKLHEDGCTRKKHSIEVLTSSPISNAVDGLACKMNTCASACTELCVSSCGRSKYFTCSQNVSKASTVLISESSFSAVYETCNKRSDSDGKVNSSVIVVSDSSNTSSAHKDGTSKSQMKHSLFSSTGELKKVVQKVQCLTVDTSDSESDVLDASCEASHKLTWSVKTPLPSDLKFHTFSNTKREKVGSPVANLEFTLSPKPPQLDNSKYRDIKNWLSEMKPSQSSDYDDPDMIPEGSSPQKDEVTGNDTKSSVHMNVSAEEILDSLYGATWRKTNMHSERPQTEPYKKCSRKEQIARQHMKCKKQTVAAESEHSNISSTESEEFEKFLKNVQQKFESTRKNSVLGTPDFIDDDNDDDDDGDDQDNSLGFYQGLLNSEVLKKDQLHLNWKMDSTRTPRANKKLSFSSSDSDGPTKEHSCSENHVTSKLRTNGKKLCDVEKNKHIKKSKKILVSPVKQSLVKKTSKTVGQTKIKSCVDKQVSNFCSPVLSFLASLSAGTPNGRCHPEAQYYKNNFKQKKEELCKKLFSLYNDKVFDNKLPHNMLVQWNTRMKQTAGFCYNRWTVTSPGTKIRSSRIAISTKVCDTADRLRDTLIHEMCHAAVWLLDGVKNGHGHHWHAWARKAARTFPELPLIKRCHDYSIQTKFTYRCTGCGYSIDRHSKSLDVATKRCGLCYGVFELLVNTRRKSGTITQQAFKTRSPIGFARFVKENYGAVKQSRTDLKHADIMRLLGQQFSAMKIVPGARKQ